MSNRLIPAYVFICYNSDGEIIGEYVQAYFPTKKDMPAGTVRVDIALPVDDNQLMYHHL